MSGSALITVEFPQFPLLVWARAQEQTDELLREFRLLSLREPEHAVPRDLLALVDEVSARFARVQNEPERRRDEAYERGESSVDLVYELPAEAAIAAVRLGLQLDAADDFCRNGQLLTLAATPEQRAFRWWFLLEFPRQQHGQPPTRFVWRD